MISYFLNWMGPVSMKWYEKNNIPYITVYKTFDKLNEKLPNKIEPHWVKEYTQSYSCGRIDIGGVEGEPYGLEYGVGVMENESWRVLGNWLWNLNTEEVLSKQELFNRFEEETGHKIKWFGGGNNGSNT